MGVKVQVKSAESTDISEAGCPGQDSASKSLVLLHLSAVTGH